MGEEKGLPFMRELATGPSIVIDKVDVGDASTAQFNLTVLVPLQLDQAPAPLAEPPSQSRIAPPQSRSVRASPDFLRRRSLCHCLSLLSWSLPSRSSAFPCDWGRS